MPERHVRPQDSKGGVVKPKSWPTRKWLSIELSAGCQSPRLHIQFGQFFLEFEAEKDVPCWSRHFRMSTTPGRPPSCLVQSMDRACIPSLQGQLIRAKPSGDRNVSSTGGGA